MPNKNHKSIDLLDTLGSPSDAWTKAYVWVSKVGRYLLVSVEVLVLGVFFSRFILDKTNNDLTEEINGKIDILSNQTLRLEEIRYNNTHALLYDIGKIQGNQALNSSEISTITSSIPSTLELTRFTFSYGKVTLSLSTTDFAPVKEYEFSLRQSPKYENVNITISKSGKNSSEIDVTVSFELMGTQDTEKISNRN